MLQYLNSGFRKFALAPIAPQVRLNWEFYAVVKGRCGVTLKEGRKEPLRSSHLWLFPPHHEHGWHGDREGCSIVAFHFGFVPEVLQRFVGAKPYIECSLTSEKARSLAGIAKELRPHYFERSALSIAYFHRALLDLTILILGDELGDGLSAQREQMERKVDRALAWFRAHLSERPSLEDMARAVSLSPSHLRRLFVAVRKQSPHAVVTHLKLEAAQALLSEADLKLDAVALESGFSGATDLCRTFKARMGCSPGQWRATILPTYESLPSSRGTAYADFEI